MCTPVLTLFHQCPDSSTMSGNIGGAAEDEPTVRQLTEIFAITEKLKEAIRNFDSNSE